MINDILNFLDIQLYYWQQQLSMLISAELGNCTPLTFTILLMAGLVTSMNPCLLSVLPLSVSYLSSSSAHTKSVSKLVFIGGVITSFITMVLVTSIVSQQYANLINVIPIFSSIFTILIGLSLLQIINIYNFTSNFDTFSFSSNTQLLQTYITGLIFGLSSTPCSTPIILIILVWLLNVKYWLLGFIYLFIYCLGYIFPLVILINYVLNYDQILNIIKSWNYLIPISGSCILGVGIFSFLQKTLM
uniref:Thiol-disulfide interchange protein n=1 Tax=Grateloupia turuturu TaxID=118375 RepID=A0A6B9P5G2_9FLOR|nr:thiol-disulfide interchange protein [Grateloupia turuturu]